MPVYYHCQRCTACCRWPGQVRLSDLDIARIAAFLDMSEVEFIQSHTRLNQQRTGLALNDQVDGSCTFLKGDDCSIQDVKPKQCRSFPNGWNFPGFEQLCQAKPLEMEAEAYQEKMRQDS